MQSVKSLIISKKVLAILLFINMITSTANTSKVGNLKTFKWGIIGCGDVTELKSGPAYQKVDGFGLEAVMRRDFTKAEDYGLLYFKLIFISLSAS